MTRAAYHRDYYWRNVEARRATARVVIRNRRERRAIIRILNQAIDEARYEFQRTETPTVDKAICTP